MRYYRAEQEADNLGGNPGGELILKKIPGLVGRGVAEERLARQRAPEYDTEPTLDP